MRALRRGVWVVCEKKRESIFLHCIRFCPAERRRDWLALWTERADHPRGYYS